MSDISIIKVGSGSYNLKMKNGVKTFLSFDAIEDVKKGDIVETLSFTQGDSGGGCYLVSDERVTATDLEKGGLFFQVIPQPKMTFAQFGILVNTQIDQMEKINNVIAYVSEHKVTIDDHNTYYVRPVRDMSNGVAVSLQLRDNLVIKNTTFKLVENCPQHTYMFGGYEGKDILFEDVTFDQNIDYNNHMFVDTTVGIQHWWSLFYMEKMQNVRFHRCTTYHQGIWVMNLSNRPEHASRRVCFEDCQFYRHYHQQSVWYDSTDIFLQGTDCHVKNCYFKSDSVDSQTAIELHCPDSSVTGCVIEGWKCGVITTNYDGNTAMYKDVSSIVISGNVVTNTIYGVSLWTTSNTANVNGITITDNIITVNPAMFKAQNCYGIGNQYSVSAKDVAWKNIVISNNTIVYNSYYGTSSDNNILTVQCGVGFMVEGTIENMTITNNIIDHCTGIPIKVTTQGRDSNNERRVISNVFIKGNNIRNAMSNPGFPNSNANTSSYIYCVGFFSNGYIGGNMGGFKHVKPYNFVTVFGGVNNDSPISIGCNYPSDIPLNYKYRCTVDTANATEVAPVYVWLAEDGLLHFEGRLNLLQNAKRVFQIPSQLSPRSTVNFLAFNITTNGDVFSYAGTGNAYLDGWTIRTGVVV